MSAKLNCEMEEQKGDFQPFSTTPSTTNPRLPNTGEPRGQSLSAIFQEALQSLNKEVESWLHHMAMSESYEGDIVAEVTALKDEIKKNNSFHREKMQQTMGQIQLLTAKPFEDPQADDS